jgi:ferric-dicitrate binding protein FerR (iron transport regulator)
MDYTNKIIIIHKYLNGALNAVESAQFEAWVNENPENKLLYDQISSLWQNAAPIKDYKFDAEKAFLSHIAKIKAESTSETPVISLIERKNIFSFRTLSAVAALFILFIAALFVITQSPFGESITAQNPEMVTLADGSKVWLDAGSVLKIKSMDQSGRRVTLSGKAYFEVAHAENNPFLIHADGFDVKVLGTRFIVDEKNATVKVRDGKVSVTKDKKQALLHDNQEIRFSGKNTGDVTASVFLSNELWFNEDLTFNKAPFDQVISDIGQQFNQRFILPKNRDWSNCTFTSGSLKNNTLDEILITLQLTYEMQYSRPDNNTIKITSVRCK